MGGSPTQPFYSNLHTFTFSTAYFTAETFTCAILALRAEAGLSQLPLKASFLIADALHLCCCFFKQLLCASTLTQLGYFSPAGCEGRTLGWRVSAL